MSDKTIVDAIENSKGAVRDLERLINDLKGEITGLYEKVDTKVVPGIESAADAASMAADLAEEAVDAAST